MPLPRRSFLSRYSNGIADEMETMADAYGPPKYIFSMHAPPRRDEKICVFNFIRIARAA